MENCGLKSHALNSRSYAFYKEGFQGQDGLGSPGPSLDPDILMFLNSLTMKQIKYREIASYKPLMFMDSATQSCGEKEECNKYRWFL